MAKLSSTDIYGDLLVTGKIKNKDLENNKYVNHVNLIKLEDFNNPNYRKPYSGDIDLTEVTIDDVLPRAWYTVTYIPHTNSNGYGFQLVSKFSTGDLYYRVADGQTWNIFQRITSIKRQCNGSANNFAEDGVYVGTFDTNSLPGDIADGQGTLIINKYITGWSFQTFISPHYNKTYTRLFNNSSWSSWNRSFDSNGNLICANNDLNYMFEPGTYTVSKDTTGVGDAVNLPPGAYKYGTLEIYGGNTSISQGTTQIYTEHASGQGRYHRTTWNRNASGWSPWVRSYDTNFRGDTGNQDYDLNITKFMRWKNFGNNHIILDASQGTSPSGSAINNTNPDVNWNPAYPTLMGWNGANTYGVRVDSSRVSDTSYSVAGEPTPGSWEAWRDRNPVVQVNTSGSDVSAYSIWRATKWGSHHLAAMDIHDNTKNGTNPRVRLVVGNSNSEFSFEGNGNFRAPRVHNAVYNDYAEYFEKDNIEESFEPGDIIISNNDKYTKSTKAYQKNVVGVFSNSYGHILGGIGNIEEDDKNCIPVGLSGRVLVKVIGEVEEGDMIVSSDIPGVGMSAKEFKMGTIIGKAVQSKNTKEIGKIKIIICLS